MLFGNYMDIVDYFMVMIYDNQYCFDTLGMLRLRCKLSLVNQHKIANNLLNST
jgi:hypothetical protein